MVPVLRDLQLLAVALVALSTGTAWANGGPFVIKHPGGDTAAKGVLARLMPDLRPGRESVLKVLREDLTVSFQHQLEDGSPATNPLAHVDAQYTIENPSAQPVTIDFGFPILHGFYARPARYDGPASMFPSPPRASISVKRNGQSHPYTVISNSMLFGVIRSIAKPIIDKALENPNLADSVRSIRKGRDSDRARRALVERLIESKGFSENDAVLLAEYASLDFAPPTAARRNEAVTQAPSQVSVPLPPRNPMADADFSFMWREPWNRDALVTANLGPLGHIGEQKATQLMALLAAKLAPKSAVSYEGILAAWGGDVRDRAVDLGSGAIRPRENKSHSSDSTVYARVDYLDPLTPAPLRRRLESILAHLPVVFTFVPMNLIHTQVTFAAKSTERVQFAYDQFGNEDTASPRSYQVAYVIHPASFWDSFGPIQLDVAAPERVSVRASVPLSRGKPEASKDSPVPSIHYQGLVPSKTGELYLGLAADEWEKACAEIIKKTSGEPKR